MAIEPAVRSIVPVVRSVSGAPLGRQETPDRTPIAPGADLALEFVRFCYHRRRVAWPALYDEMSAVASRGAFRGMGYVELGEHGVSFCLSDMSRLVELAERVVAEDRGASEAAAAAAPMTLKAVPA